MATYLKSLRIGELRDLYRANVVELDSKVRALAQQTERTEQHIAEMLGRPIVNCDVLEVGAGQRTPFKYRFGSRNRYVGIDIEPPPTGAFVGDFVEDLRRRGTTRAVKNLLKSVVGVTRKFDAAMKREFACDTPDATLLEMDAEQMAFEDNSFDVAISHNVFEHLPNPEAVMAEIARVLRPGGVVHIHTHLYTSDSGAHDPRLYIGDRKDFPYWAHLRTETAGLVKPNCYVNKIRLDHYIEAFDKVWPGCAHTKYPSSETLRLELTKLREAGQLSDYRDDELLTNVLRTTWRKPIEDDSYRVSGSVIN